MSASVSMQRCTGGTPAVTKRFDNDVAVLFQGKTVSLNYFNAASNANDVRVTLTLQFIH